MPGNSFATAELGVIAQYAHLAWYVYPSHLSDPYCVLVARSRRTVRSPPPETRATSCSRTAVRTRGNVRTVYELSAKWAVGPDYGAAIQKKAAGIVLSVGLW